MTKGDHLIMRSSCSQIFQGSELNSEIGRDLWVSICAAFMMLIRACIWCEGECG